MAAEHDEYGGLTDDERAYFDGLYSTGRDEGTPASGGGVRLGSAAPRTWDTGTFVDRVDLGPGGSLLQQYRAATPRIDWRHVVTAVLLIATAAGICVTVLAFARGAIGWAFLALLAALAAGTASVQAGQRLAHPAAWLRERARRERRVARALKPLETAGWVVLHDRLVPDTEHRLAHLAIGPTGISVITPLPQDGILRIEYDPTDGAELLYINGQSFQGWQQTRAWEAQRTVDAVTGALDDIVWDAPCLPILVWFGDGTLDPLNRRPRLPAVDHTEGMHIVPPDGLAHALADLPATLGPKHVRYVAATLETVFRPAGREPASMP